jgi:hypothetical protein
MFMLFELLFVVLVLTLVVSVVVAAISALRGRPQRAFGIVRRILLGAAIYFTVVIVASAVTPRSVFPVGHSQCFDDWCIAVVAAENTPTDSGRLCAVTIQLSSRARRAPQRERGTVVYLIDGGGRRYDPLPSPDYVPLDVLMQPGESVILERRFAIPPTADHLSLVYTHEGDFPIGWFIIGEGGWFAKRPIMQVPE